jgi:hypothetical protein
VTDLTFAELSDGESKMLEPLPAAPESALPSVSSPGEAHSGLQTSLGNSQPQGYP